MKAIEFIKKWKLRNKSFAVGSGAGGASTQMASCTLEEALDKFTEEQQKELRDKDALIVELSAGPRIHDPKGLMKLQFKCPKCGSHKFGTAGETGYCHGDSWCKFKWDREVEDSNVFVGRI